MSESAVVGQEVTSRISRFKTALALYACPGILIAVALLQIYRAHACEQSPWKGGGFGMFSTVDDPGSRFFRCFLLLEGGESPVYIPRGLTEEVRRVRVAPTDQNLEELARELLHSTWVHRDYHRRQFLAAAAQGRSRPADAANAAGPDLPADAAPVDDAPRDGSPAASPAKAAAPLSEAAYRVKAREEPEPSRSDQVDVKGLRLELWRYAFDPAENRLRARRSKTLSLSKPAAGPP